MSYQLPPVLHFHRHIGSRYKQKEASVDGNACYPGKLCKIRSFPFFFLILNLSATTTKALPISTCRSLHQKCMQMKIISLKEEIGLQGYHQIPILTQAPTSIYTLLRGSPTASLPEATKTMPMLTCQQHFEKIEVRR